MRRVYGDQRAKRAESDLLQLLGGLDKPSSGEVLFQNELGIGDRLDTYRAPWWLYLPAFYLLPTLRAIENVQVPMLALPGNGNRGRTAEALLRRWVGTSAYQYPNELSRETAARGHSARTGNHPEICWRMNRRQTSTASTRPDHGDSYRIQNQRGMTLIIVTHENEIANAAPRHVRIRDGESKHEDFAVGNAGFALDVDCFIRRKHAAALAGRGKL